MTKETPDVSTTLQAFQDFQDQIDTINDSIKTVISTPKPSKSNVMIDPLTLPQGPGSLLNSDQVDGINANTKPFPNCLVPLNSLGQFPVSTIPGSTGGTGFAFGNVTPTDANILVADGVDWESTTLSGDATIADTGVLTLANTAVTPGTYGDSTHVSRVTVDSKGRITAASNVSLPSTSPGGTNGSVQFNNSSAFGGDATNFFWDSTNHYLGLRVASPSTTLQIKGQQKIIDATISETNLPDWGYNNSPNLGILQIWTKANYPLVMFQAEAGSGNTFSTGFEVIRQNGTTGSETALGANDDIGFMGFAGSTAANAFNAAARIYVKPDGAWSSTSSPGQMQFQISTSGSLSSLNTRMVIKQDGKVGIGTLTPGALLEVNGTVLFDSTFEVSGAAKFDNTIQVSGDTTGGGTTVGFGTNSPASTLTAPYTWLKFISSDGSTVYVAAFK